MLLIPPLRDQKAMQLSPLRAFHLGQGPTQDAILQFPWELQQQLLHMVWKRIIPVTSLIRIN